jgi:hypothetical protein
VDLSGTGFAVVKKVIVLGLDGLEPPIVERLLRRNELPNLGRLREVGVYAPPSRHLPCSNLGSLLPAPIRAGTAFLISSAAIPKPTCPISP